MIGAGECLKDCLWAWAELFCLTETVKYKLRSKSVSVTIAYNSQGQLQSSPLRQVLSCNELYHVMNGRIVEVRKVWFLGPRSLHFCFCSITHPFYHPSNRFRALRPSFNNNNNNKCSHRHSPNNNRNNNSSS